MSKVKTCYSVALRNLEQISEQIHAQRGRRRAARRTRCTYEGRTSPIGAESEGGASGGEVESDWVLSEKTRQWVERHSESGWGVRERAEMERAGMERAEMERAGSDTMSVFSLRTIASDLEKCDSVEHLGNLSDIVSLVGDEGEKDRGKTDALDVVRRGQEAWVREAEATVVAAAEGSEKQKSFLKQHHRSVSL